MISTRIFHVKSCSLIENFFCIRDYPTWNRRTVASSDKGARDRIDRVKKTRKIIHYRGNIETRGKKSEW